MSTSEETIVGVDSGSKKKKMVWLPNTMSALSTVFAASLSSHDSITRCITAVCLTLGVVFSCLSLRRRFNILGLVILFITAYLYAFFLITVFKTA